MNWKDAAVEKLERLNAMRQAVRNIPEEMCRLEIDAQCIRGAAMEKSGVKACGEKKKEDALLSNFIRRQELKWNLKQAKIWLQTVHDAMKILTPEEVLILNRLIVNPERKGLERLCMELGVEQSSIYRRRDKALRRFAIALYGFAET